jgi:hypothetical protein
MSSNATVLLPVTGPGPSFDPDLLSPLQIEVLTAVSRISSSLSLISTLVVILTFFTWKRFRTAANRLIFFMAIADCVSALTVLMGRCAFTLYYYIMFSIFIINYTVTYVPDYDLHHLHLFNVAIE